MLGEGYYPESGGFQAELFKIYAYVCEKWNIRINFSIYTLEMLVLYFNNVFKVSSQLINLKNKLFFKK